MNIIEFKKEFDPLLFEFVDKKITEFSKDNDLKFLSDQFAYIKKFIKDGKRIRPFIAYLSYSSFGGKKGILNNLIFLELFHNFCLVHDDIMDNSLTRHGISTVNKQFGTSSAILLGDYLYSWTWESINNLKLNENITLGLKILFSEMTAEVFLGQAIDVNLDSNKQFSDDLLVRKTLLKTAGYTFTNPMLIGLLLSNNYNKKNKNSLVKLGENLGLAFQIQDDLLDITSDFDGKKKPLGDVSEGKPTLVSNFVFANGSTKQKSELKKVWGKEIKNTEKIREIFYESGAISFAENLINQYYSEAKNLAKDKEEFLELINLLENRKS